jgi:cell cycle related kinase
VVQLLDVFPQGLGFVLVFEFMPSGLWEMLRDAESPLSVPQVKTYMIMLLTGVAYLHEHSIMHRVRYYSPFRDYRLVAVDCKNQK